MTALQKYDRLEGAGLWRPSPEEQRREVIISIGDATLVITDLKDQPLAHWSLPALERANPGQRPAIYHPDGDPGETLELAEDEADIIEAIEKLRTAIDRRRPHPGRLRLLMLVLSTTMVAALGLFWLPGALHEHTVSVVPGVKRQAIGEALFTHMQRVTGQSCAQPTATPALNTLSARLSGQSPMRLMVMRSGVRDTVLLPGNILLMNRALIEDFEEPDVAAGYVIAEQLRAQQHDPLARLLEESGLTASFRLLTTGTLPDEVLRSYAENLLTAPHMPVGDADLLGAFATHQVQSSPYAYALDISGETTLGLIEADPFANTPTPVVLSDADWVRLQGICGN